MFYFFFFLFFKFVTVSQCFIVTFIRTPYSNKHGRTFYLVLVWLLNSLFFFNIDFMVMTLLDSLVNV